MQNHMSTKTNVILQEMTPKDSKITWTAVSSHVTWVMHHKIGSEERVGTEG